MLVSVCGLVTVRSSSNIIAIRSSLINNHHNAASQRSCNLPADNWDFYPSESHLVHVSAAASVRWGGSWTQEREIPELAALSPSLCLSVGVSCEMFPIEKNPSSLWSLLVSCRLWQQASVYSTPDLYCDIQNCQSFRLLKAKCPILKCFALLKVQSYQTKAFAVIIFIMKSPTTVVIGAYGHISMGDHSSGFVYKI